MSAFAPSRCIYTSGDSIEHKYRVLKLLGEGTFGTVYKVLDHQGRILALKLLKLWEVHPSDRENIVRRFDMEYETGQIESNHLVRSLGHGSVEGNPYILMEFCANGDLRKRRDITTHELTDVAIHILLGLRDLHRCGKIHRDLKPDNVLFRSDGTAVLTDFGISGDQNKRMTERGWLGRPQQIFGTYGYMPPEQVRPPRGGKATVLPTTDIFSFGVMMYEQLVGRLPFGELRCEADLISYLGNGKKGVWDREALRSLRASVNWLHVIECCLVPDFKQRAQSVDDILSLFPHPLVVPKADLPRREVQGKILLRIMQGEEYGKTYMLDELVHANRSLLTIGRQSTDVHNDISILEEQSRYISRQHCTLELNRKTRRWYIRDGQWERYSPDGWKHSLNGTYLNSSEVSVLGTPLCNGDIISIGDVKMRVEFY